MNNGKISVRYARAFYNYAVENHCEDSVYKELNAFTFHYEQHLSQFNNILNNPILSKEDKIKLLVSASGDEISNCLLQFIKFVVEHQRENKIYLMALSFQKMYRANKNILHTSITTATELPEKTMDDIKSFVENAFKSNVEVQASVEQNLIGGFTLDIENTRLDASIAGQLKELRKAL
jgi:ATP synthase, F1 delta subunit